MTPSHHRLSLLSKTNTEILFRAIDRKTPFRRLAGVDPDDEVAGLFHLQTEVNSSSSFFEHQSLRRSGAKVIFPPFRSRKLFARVAELVDAPG
jgi:hypothetical protein